MLFTAIGGSAEAAGLDALVLESLRRDRPELPSLYGSLAALYAAGADIDWARVYEDRPGFAALPAYPWQRSRYWHQPTACPWPPLGGEPARRPAAAEDGHPPEPLTVPSREHPLLGRRIEGSDGPLWQRFLGPNSRFLTDHRVDGEPVMPGAGYLELVQAATVQLVPNGEGCVGEVEFLELLALPDSDEGGGSASPAAPCRDPAGKAGRTACATTYRGPPRPGRSTRRPGWGRPRRAPDRPRRRSPRSAPGVLDACLHAIAAALPSAPRSRGEHRCCSAWSACACTGGLPRDRCGAMPGCGRLTPRRCWPI